MTAFNLREEFVEKMGLIFQADGMPRIAGRILGLLVFEGRAFSFAELAETLGVSRGSISTNARILSDKGMIERVGMPADRQDYYQFTEESFESILRNISEGLLKTSAEVRKFSQRVDDDEALTKRLNRFAEFHDAVAAGVQNADKYLAK